MSITKTTLEQYPFVLSFVWQQTGLIYIGLAFAQLAWFWRSKKGAANRLAALIAAAATAVLAWWVSASTLWLVGSKHVPAGEHWWVNWVPTGIILAACLVAIALTTTAYLKATHVVSAV